MKAFSSPLALARFALALTLTAPVLMPGALAQTDPAIEARLNARFDELAEAGFAGFAVIAQEGEIIFSRGAGVADPETQRPFTLDTQIDTGSITKSFTGMAIANLIDSGRLSPDAVLAEFFDDLPADKAGITVQQLLTHSAGFPGAVGDDFAEDGWETFAANAFNADLLFEPGTRYAYSNVGFSLLAAIIERVTGQGYEDYLVNNLLVPAGITHTGYELAYDDALAARSRTGQPVRDASWGGHAPSWYLIGNGGLVSTPRDMIAWEHAYTGGTLVSPAAREMAHTPYMSEGEGAPSFYGYGVVVEDDPQGGRIYWHNGGNGAFNSHWRVLADHGYELFATTNQRGISTDTAILALTAALMDQPFEVQRPADTSGSAITLPDTTGGRMAAEFLAMIASDDEAVWREFVVTRMGPDLLAFAPVDGHLQMMGQIHDNFGQAEVIAVEESEGRITLSLRDPQTSDVIPVVLEYSSNDGESAPLFTGLLLG